MATTKHKGLIRSLNRRGSTSGKLAPPEHASGRLREPAACEKCGAIFARRAWRRSGRISHALLARSTWTLCPGCKQAGAGEGQGRVLMTGRFVADHEAEIRTRLANVAALATARQPLRRIVSVTAIDGGLEVLSTSQKLAHRVVHEMSKAFRGRARYVWSDDGTLFATWHRGDGG